MKLSFSNIPLRLPACAAVLCLISACATSPVQLTGNYMVQHIQNEITSQNKAALVVVYQGWFTDQTARRHTLRNVVRFDANGNWKEVDGAIDGKHYDPNQSVVGLLTGSFITSVSTSVMNTGVRAHAQAYPLITAPRNEIDVEPGVVIFQFGGQSYTGTRIRSGLTMAPNDSVASPNNSFSGVVSLDETDIVSQEFPPYLYSTNATRQFKVDADQGHLPWSKNLTVVAYHFE